MSVGEPSAPFRRRLLVRGALLALAGVGLAAGLFVVAQFPPTDDSFYPKCSFHRVTGWHCPGCGTTRALHALLNGRVEQAVAYNAFVFLALPVVAWSAAKSVWSWAGGPTRPRRPRRPASVVWKVLTWSLVGLMLIFWVVRNIPVSPFTLLAPHELSP